LDPYGVPVVTELSRGTGDKLADIEEYAWSLRGSLIPEEVAVGVNLMLILKGKNR